MFRNYFVHFNYCYVDQVTVIINLFAIIHICIQIEQIIDLSYDYDRHIHSRSSNLSGIRLFPKIIKKASTFWHFYFIFLIHML